MLTRFYFECILCIVITTTYPIKIPVRTVSTILEVVSVKSEQEVKSTTRGRYIHRVEFM